MVSPVPIRRISESGETLASAFGDHGSLAYNSLS